MPARRINRFFLFAILPVIGAPFTVDATVNGAGKIHIGWEEVRKAVDRHPAIRAHAHKIAAAKSAQLAAREVPNPALAASAGYGMAIDGSESRVEWGLELEIPLDWLGKRKARIEQAGAEVRALKAERDSLRRDVLLKLRLLFWELLYSQEQVAALEDMKEHATTFANTVKSRADSGEVRPAESSQAQLEVSKISGELLLARAALTSSRKKLSLWLTVDGDATLYAMGRLADLPQPAADTAPEPNSLELHPDLRSKDAVIAVASAAVKTEERALIPGFALTPFFDSELDRRAVGLGVSMELPLWNHNKGNISRARNDLFAQKAERDMLLLELQTDFVEFEARCNAGVQVAASYRDTILPEVESVANTIERTYELGEASFLEVLSATHSLLETRLQFISAALNAHVACSRLYAMKGEDL